MVCCMSVASEHVCSAAAGLPSLRGLPPVAAEPEVCDARLCRYWTKFLFAANLVDVVVATTVYSMHCDVNKSLQHETCTVLRISRPSMCLPSFHRKM